MFLDPRAPGEGFNNSGWYIQKRKIHETLANFRKKNQNMTDLHQTRRDIGDGVGDGIFETLVSKASETKSS